MPWTSGRRRSPSRGRSTSQGSEADTFLAEAESEARSLGEPERGGFGLLWFGPTSVGVWRVSVATELADNDTAIATAQAVDPRPMQAPNRVVYYWIDYGRALASAGNDDEAVHAFSEAEMVDPQRFRMDPIVRDSVSALVHRAKKRAVTDGAGDGAFLDHMDLDDAQRDLSTPCPPPR